MGVIIGGSQTGRPAAPALDLPGYVLGGFSGNLADHFEFDLSGSMEGFARPGAAGAGAARPFMVEGPGNTGVVVVPIDAAQARPPTPPPFFVEGIRPADVIVHVGGGLPGGALVGAPLVRGRPGVVGGGAARPATAPVGDPRPFEDPTAESKPRPIVPLTPEEIARRIASDRRIIGTTRDPVSVPPADLARQPRSNAIDDHIG